MLIGPKPPFTRTRTPIIVRVCDDDFAGFEVGQNLRSLIIGTGEKAL
jgi:hypothetical protein